MCGSSSYEHRQNFSQNILPTRTSTFPLELHFSMQVAGTIKVRLPGCCGANQFTQEVSVAIISNARLSLCRTNDILTLHRCQRVHDVMSSFRRVPWVYELNLSRTGMLSTAHSTALSVQCRLLGRAFESM